MKHAYAALAFLLVMMGCQSLGITPAKTLSDRIAYAAGTNAALRQTAANALNAHTLSSADAEYVLSVTDNTRTLLDASKLALGSGDPNTAQDRVTLALNVLDQLQVYLNSRVQK